MNTDELRAALEQLRRLPAPPHSLTAENLLAAGRRTRRRRRLAGAIAGAVAAAGIVVMLVLLPQSGSRPVMPGDPGTPTPTPSTSGPSWPPQIPAATPTY
jgi:hypothetical protein